MKQVIVYILIFMSFFIGNSQNNQLSILNSCKSDFFHHYLYPKFGKDFVKKHFSLNEEKSSFNYIDPTTKESYLRIGLKDSDTINGSPNEYYMVLNILHQESEIGSVRLKCYYNDNVIRSERIKADELKDILKPYLKVINGKSLNIDKILDIAKKEGFHNIAEQELDYEKNSKNENKWFFPRLIWTLKEKYSNNGRNYVKTIQINAKNGRVLKKW